MNPKESTVPAPAPSDAELIRRAIARDNAAIRTIIERHNRRLFRIARGILRDDNEAEDAVQEAYFKAFTHLESFRGDASLATWLSRIAMNEALARLRGGPTLAIPLAAMPQKAEAHIIPFPQSIMSTDPEKNMAQRQMLDLVERCVDDLPDAFRIVFIARVIEGLSVQETAELLDIQPETVKTRLFRARRFLRQRITKEIGPVFLNAFPFAGLRCNRMTARVLERLGFKG